MLFEREIEILNILWKADCALAAFEIVEEGNRLSQSTVQAILRKLLKEELVEVEGVKYSGNVLTRTYRPASKTREMMRQQTLKDILNATYIIGEDKAKEIEKILMSEI